jgi:hypothetical protein
MQYILGENHANMNNPWDKRMRRDDNVCNHGRKVWLWAKMKRPAVAVSLHLVLGRLDTLRVFACLIPPVVLPSASPQCTVLPCISSNLQPQILTVFASLAHASNPYMVATSRHAVLMPQAVVLPALKGCQPQPPVAWYT